MTTNYNVPTYYNLPTDITIATGGSNITSLAKFGFTADIAATERTVWDGAANTNANYLAAASKINFVSDDANDTAAGTGARTFQAHGLDPDGKEISEVITLDGTTLVTSALTFGTAPNRQKVLTAGSGGMNAGTIYAFTGTETDGTPADLNLVYSIIKAGENQTLQCNYTVPASRIGLMDFCEITSLGGNNAEGTFRLVMRPESGVWQTKRKFVISQGNISRFWRTPLSVAAKTDIEIRGERTSGSGSLAVSAEFDMRLVPAG